MLRAGVGWTRRLASSLSKWNKYTGRTHTCGELRKQNEGERVCVSGWLSHRRMGRFLVLRDAYGSVQARVDKDAFSISSIPYESVIRVEGVVRSRGADANEKMPTGDVEIDVTSLEVVNAAPKSLPLMPNEEASERTRLRYRYLEMRGSSLQSALRLRSRVTHNIRRFLDEEAGFVDVETPTLFRRTPGGAAEFLVPAPKPNQGKFYSLPQSPQQFKQLLMVGGIDRYYQIARCYRDEGSKLDRQPEFTQVDVEMSFTSQEGVMSLVEDMLVAAIPQDLSHLRPTAPFPRMRYEEAMRLYGCDKPDMRVPWKIDESCSSLLSPLRGSQQGEAGAWTACVFVARGAASSITTARKKEWKRLVDMNQMAQPFTVLNGGSKKRWFNFVENETLSERLGGVGEEDAVVVSWGESDGVRWTLGQLRNLVGEAAGLRKGGALSLLWVVDFPLFVREEGRIVACHHPFTAPADGQTIEGDVEHIKAQHYDLVLNGVELGGGSIRIHNGDEQERVLREVLGEEPEEMAHLLEALRMGAPPHGGFALGLDRLCAMLVGEGDCSVGVRDVIAFPKSKEGRDLMAGAPCEPSKEQLERYAIRVEQEEQEQEEEGEREKEQ